MTELAAFMDTLGHGVPAAELESMMKELGIEEDADATIDKRNFLEFMRRCFVADLPASKMDRVHALFLDEAYKRDEASRREADEGPPILSPAARPRQSKQAPLADAPSALAERSLQSLLVAPDGSAQNPKALGELVEHHHMAESPARHSHVRDAESTLAVSRAQAAKLLQTLGFILDELSLTEFFDELDADGACIARIAILAYGDAGARRSMTVHDACDNAGSCLLCLTGDGLMSEEEFIACIGMIKCDLLETMHLERSFKSFRQTANANYAVAAGATADANTGEEDEVHQVYATDLVGALGVTLVEAEEMIFIADLKDNQSIDFTEFKQVVVSWSG